MCSALPENGYSPRSQVNVIHDARARACGGGRGGGGGSGDGGSGSTRTGAAHARNT